MKKILPIVLTVFAAIISTAAVVSAASAPRPNILYLYVDDMGWGSIGPNGQAARKAKGLAYVKTPNLDQLAAEGVNFSRGYGCHVCSPARSSQQSGFHQGHTFADRNDPDNAKKAMRADDILMGDALAAAGYTTGYWGKWGYGGSQEQKNPVIQNVQTLPTSHGYKYVLAELHHVRAHTFFQPTLWSAPAKSGAKGGLELAPNSVKAFQNDSYPSTPAMQNEKGYPEVAYCDDTYAFAALDFVRSQAQAYNKSGRPFFGLFAAQIPHAPFDEISKLPKWADAYKGDPYFTKLPKQSQQWAAMVTRIDGHFGNLLDALKDPNGDGDTSDSVAENTLVIFQSDNGGPGGSTIGSMDANGGLSGSKGSIQEGGIRVPLVMRWPAKITKSSALKAGSDSQMIVDVTDLLPTFCELAGQQIPLGVDGVSIAPTLSGEGIQRKREFLIHEAGNGQSIIRGNQKLVRGGGKKNSEWALYDLEKDRAEKKNIAKQHPERVKELEALLLGERVAEERGFSNTYHSWIGKPGAATSQADNWSDYVYANEGIAYQTDEGAPQLSWTAHVRNTGQMPNEAKVDRNLEVLALDIRGASGQAPQALSVASGMTVHGRNEVRVSDFGHVELNGGTVSSLRWLDVQSGGTLSGSGTIDADLFAQGVIHAGTLHVNGTAYLGGTLTMDGGSGGSVLTAERVVGTFSNPNHIVVSDGGKKFKIEYTNTAVTLTAVR